MRARLLANDELPEHYRAAGVVLNDHWDDMRAEGFYSNRLFDAAASGARVVSDHIEGTERLFGGLVRTYRAPEDLVALVRGANDLFPDADERAADRHPDRRGALVRRAGESAAEGGPGRGGPSSLSRDCPSVRPGDAPCMNAVTSKNAVIMQFVNAGRRARLPTFRHAV